MEMANKDNTTNIDNTHNKEVMVQLKDLVEASGVPTDFIKKELMVDDTVSMDELRAKMLKFLDATFEENGVDTTRLN
ncbi:hypothetical protein BALOs_2446 [Halobacteriovorax sp. BALOs_7]|uniref:DEK C-terminal domain-containing protein n=2 Tax=Halobacteriovorax TaxID=1652133 RepID=A0ABY0IHV4_9BACT|nr:MULTISPECIES: hypothetical protein [Halobacteriovorax]AYF45443.1 hypothetical protein BALOs_2446 [Halobacteriovorax sp. BALOs_7]RZF22523.1 hypothetical protein DAY19_01770 [Halobacteriovorax vibrionivorans]TGD47715.1 hypothetical protein EP118_07135 [Halobacteriovorax sp. Y22]